MIFQFPHPVRLSVLTSDLCGYNMIVKMNVLLNWVADERKEEGVREKRTERNLDQRTNSECWNVTTKMVLCGSPVEDAGVSDECVKKEEPW